MTLDSFDRSIVVDLSAALNQSAGIGRYARELTRQLIPMLEPDVRIWYAPDDSTCDQDLLNTPPWSRLPVAKSPFSRQNLDRAYFRYQLPLGRLLSLGNPSDVYSPDFTAPTTAKSRTHITVHDLAWLHPEARTPAPLARFLGPVVERAVQSASTVFTVSGTVRQEILETYQIPECRISVASNAADERFFAAEPLEPAWLVTNCIDRPFLLYIGTIEPRKNLLLLFEALTHLPPDLQLVLVGKGGWDAEAILAGVRSFGVSERVLRLGFVPDQLLPRLVASASAVVYPSCYEGFGLPIVEGLAAGVPVAASDLEVFHEVGGDEVSFFDPRDPQDLARAIEVALQSDQSTYQARSRRQAWARRFAWQESAEIVASRLLETG